MPNSDRDPSSNKLPTMGHDASHGGIDVMKTEFLKETLEKEAHKYGLEVPAKGLTDYQLHLLERIKNMDKEPVQVVYPGSLRTDAQIAGSQALHKRVNSGYVDMPYTCSSQEQFKYSAPPDFSRAYLKKKSDCDFQGFAAEAILKHVDLKKTAH